MNTITTIINITNAVTNKLVTQHRQVLIGEEGHGD